MKPVYKQGGFYYTATFIAHVEGHDVHHALIEGIEHRYYTRNTNSSNHYEYLTFKHRSGNKDLVHSSGFPTAVIPFIQAHYNLST